MNGVLLPKWLHRVILVPANKYYHDIDTLCSNFVCDPEGCEPLAWPAVSPRCPNKAALGEPQPRGGDYDWS